MTAVVLPSRMDDAVRDALLAWGVVLGDPVAAHANAPPAVHATLPPGWRLVDQDGAEEGATHQVLVDGHGRDRADAKFTHDPMGSSWSALHLLPRFRTCCVIHATTARAEVWDGPGIVYVAYRPGRPGEDPDDVECAAFYRALDWLDATYPGWTDPLAYR